MTDAANMGQSERPTIAIDLGRGEVLAANAEGRALIGIAPECQLPFAIDIAMPAITRLRTLQHADTEPGTQVYLNFWRKGRSIGQLCRVAFPETGKPLVIIQVAEGHTNGAEPTGEAAIDATRDTAQKALAATVDQPSTARATATVIAKGKPDHDPVAPSLDTGVVASTPASNRLAPLPDDEMDAPPPEGGSAASSEHDNQPAPRTDHETLAEIARRIREGQSSCDNETAKTQDDAQRAPSEPGTTTIPTADIATETALADSNTSASALDLARLAHELKTPLTAITAAAEVMRDERLGPMHNARYRDYAADIHDSSSHALAVISRMLSREATTSADPTPEAARQIDLHAIVRDARTMVQAAAIERNIEIETISYGGSSLVTADATSLRQIVINLLHNAVKFTPRAGKVRIFAGHLDDGTPYLAIRDEGAGLDPQIVAKARIANDTAETTRRKGGGYGLGLPLVLRLAEDIGVDVTFDSKPGKGTVALVTFRSF